MSLNSKIKRGQRWYYKEEYLKQGALRDYAKIMFVTIGTGKIYDNVVTYRKHGDISSIDEESFLEYYTLDKPVEVSL